MKLASHKLCGPIAIALLIYTVPVAAQELPTPNREFQVNLDELFTLEPLDFGAEALALEAAAQPVRIAALETLPIRDARRLDQVTHAQSTTAKDGKMKRSMRYMKKHWWIPTLIGLAVAVVILEPFDDDADDRRQAQMMNP